MLVVVLAVGAVSLFPINGGSPRVIPLPTNTPSADVSPEGTLPSDVALTTVTPPALDTPPTATGSARTTAPLGSPTVRDERPACSANCLVRLQDPGTPARDSLMERGLQPAYAYDGSLWASASSALIDQLRGEGTEIVVVELIADTLPLYAVRLPDGATDDTPIRQIGEILDRVGSQFIVKVEAFPPRITELVDHGIWIEKFPPVIERAERTETRPLLQSIDAFSGTLSADALSKTIVDLQSIGSVVGSENTRHYLSPGNVAAAEYIFRRMAEYGLGVRYEDFVADTGVIATNVVGELPGRDPSKVYLIVAHFDSLAETEVAPGADDNASGVAGMIEIARVLSQFDLPYSVRFVALTGEEAALQGAEAFGRQAEIDNVAYVAGFNLDAIGSSGRDHQLVINGDTTTVWLQEMLVEANDIQGTGQDLVIRQNQAIVADDNVLRTFGIPAVLVTRAVVGDNPLHHTADDVIQNLDLHGVEEATLLTMIALGMLLTDQ